MAVLRGAGDSSARSTNFEANALALRSVVGKSKRPSAPFQDGQHDLYEPQIGVHGGMRTNVATAPGLLANLVGQDLTRKSWGEETQMHHVCRRQNDLRARSIRPERTSAKSSPRRSK